jgi:cell fate regulator YaaT (PSP1 superfamily)
MNTYDWLSVARVEDVEGCGISEVSFKNGAHKSFYRNSGYRNLHTGDYVAVDTGGGYDVGQISLSGELVRLQMAKKRINESKVVHQILRKANTRDLERLKQARQKERDTLIRARAIAKSLDLDMKMGDVEFQADLRKATFYYTANGRIDFRELVRVYAKEFKIKIEMRQVGMRQESAFIGGLGSCGRELCCSTWLSDFKSVPTSSARYQNLAINQTKLSGQCGRLKCCLNYELDTYMDALNSFPMYANTLKTNIGNASFIKADIFKDVMYYAHTNPHGRSLIISIDKERVAEIHAMNKRGDKPDTFITEEAIALEEEMDFADVTGDIELKEEVKRKRSSRRRKKKPRAENSSSQSNRRKKPRSGRRRSGNNRPKNNKKNK